MSQPPLKLLTLTEMKLQHPVKNAPNMTLRGYYHLLEKKIDIFEDKKLIDTKLRKLDENICIIDGLKNSDFLATAIHELTHDWLGDYYPGIKVAPLWIEEGCCQYLTYIYCKQQKFDILAKKIAQSPDKIYGDGFRFYLKNFGEDNWAGALKWLGEQGYLKKPAPSAVRRVH